MGVREFVWVWVCVTESSSHHKHLSLYSHTTNLSDIQYSRYCQTIESVVVSITYLHTQSGESSYLPFTMADIRQSDLPPCIIHISGTCKEVIKHTVSTLSLSLSCVCPNAHCVIWCCVLYGEMGGNEHSLLYQSQRRK